MAEWADPRYDEAVSDWRQTGATIAVFAVIAMALVWITPPAHENPFNGPMLVAARMLEGHGDIPLQISWMESFTHEGKRYLAYPPMAALVMVPYAALGGQAWGQTVFNSLMIFGTSFLLFRLFSAVSSLRPLALWAPALYVFGTPVLFNARVGSVWLLMHSEGNFFFVLALWLAAARRGFLLAGVAFMTAVQVRYAILMAAPVFVLLALLEARDLSEGVRRAVWFGAGCLPPGLLVLVHNGLLFGDPFFSSYLATWAEWGQAPMSFSVDHVARNLRFYTTALPVWRDAWPYLTFPSAGQTIFLMSPFFLGLLVPRWRSSLVRACAPGILLMFGFYLTYSFQGSTQVGSRYMQDLYPLLFPVALSAFSRPGRAWRPALWGLSGMAVLISGFASLTVTP